MLCWMWCLILFVGIIGMKKTIQNDLNPQNKILHHQQRPLLAGDNGWRWPAQRIPRRDVYIRRRRSTHHCEYRLPANGEEYQAAAFGGRELY